MNNNKIVQKVLKQNITENRTGLQKLDLPGN